MHRPTAAFKLSKQSKTLLAGILDPQMRSQVKKLLVDAELSALMQPKTLRVPKSDFKETDNG
jgi:hypothetical protein